MLGWLGAVARLRGLDGRGRASRRACAWCVCRRAIVGAWRERRSGASATARARRVLEWCRDGAAQQGSSAAVAQQRGCSSALRGAARQQHRVKGGRRERGRERSQRVDLKFSKNFQLKLKKF